MRQTVACRRTLHLSKLSRIVAFARMRKLRIVTYPTTNFYLFYTQLVLAGQIGRKITDVSITIEYDPSSRNESIPSNDDPLATNSRSAWKTLFVLVSALLAVLAVYALLHYLELI